MSSDSEISVSCDSSDTRQLSEDEEQDLEVVYSQFAPYQDELLSEEDDESRDEDIEEADADGLTARILKARYERTVVVNSWLVELFYICGSLAPLCFRCDC